MGIPGSQFPAPRELVRGWSIPDRILGTMNDVIRLVMAGLLLAACSKDGPSTGTFQPARETEARMPSREPEVQAPIDDSGGLALTWDLPAGWTALPASAFRQANFRLPGNDKAECYLSLFPNEVGGLEGNITRWRTQLALPPLSAAESAALPKAELLGHEGVLFDFVGTWKGMNGSENEPAWRLVGILQVDPAGSAFFKMYGPDALIAAEKEHFLALARSLRPGQADPHKDPHAGSAANTAQPPPMDPSDPAVASMAGDQQGLAWMAPGTWTKGPDKVQRTVTYQTPGGAECYVTVMGGEAGGLGGNVNRWRDQMGCPALPTEELEKLEHLAMLGGDGRMVTIEGAGAQAGKGLIGALVLAGTRTIFVKMTGPMDAIAKETENFKAFAQSLKEAK